VTKLLIFVILIFADLISKFFIKNNLTLDQFIFINDFIDIVYVKNYGVSFGLFSGVLSYWVFILIALIIVLFVIYLMLISKNKFEKNAYFLIIIGALANILDRAINGYVVDFISLHYNNYFWPSFNLADIYITIGIIMLILNIFLDNTKKQ
tara:strand:- start:446 stop:898 length:453 start_codon:yes stop_codon:yes gene_type:complete